MKDAPGLWKTMPMRSVVNACRALSGRAVSSVPSSVTDPERMRSFGVTPSRARSSVLLPQPLSPTRQRISPRCSVKLTSATATLAPPS